MKIVSVSEIPEVEEIVDTPVGDLIAVYKICQDMVELCERENGIGLSAVQVGIPWRLCVMKSPDGNFEFLVNCDYEPVGDKKVVSIEGCLSLRRDGELRRFRLHRWEKVCVKGSVISEGSDGKLMLKELDYKTQSNIYNIIHQHEIDHQLGVAGLISKKGEEIYL